MLLKIIRKQKPDYLIVTFDTKGPTQRHQEYKAYKAQRPEMPDELSIQLPIIHRLVSAFQIPILTMDGYEADDLIGTLAKHAERQGLDVTIVTGDKDMFQLITPKIHIYDTMKEKTFEQKDVQERFGVEPSRMTEIMGLMGDAIDNIPGVPGIGEKTAIKLIREFNTIEGLLKNLDRIHQPKIRENLKKHSDLARLSRQLATIQTDCPITMDIMNLKPQFPNLPELTNLFRELEFTGLLKKVTEVFEINSTPTTAKVSSSLLTQPYRLITNSRQLSSLIRQATESNEMVIEPWPPEETNDRWVGMSICLPNDNFYIPIRHDTSPQMEEKLIIKQLNILLGNSSVGKLGHDLKSMLIRCRNQGLVMNGLAFDTGIASYLLNPSRHDHRLETSALEYLEKTLSPLPEASDPTRISADVAAASLCERGQSIFQLSKKLMPMLTKQGLANLFQAVEMPLIAALADMEYNGIKLDIEGLKNLSKELDQQLSMMVNRIYTLAGAEFNINSPKQLSEILFERIGLKPIKRTKTGYSTNEEVLQQLGLEHELPAEVLNYRQLTKLKSTYVDVLPRLANPKTSRIHTSFNQTATATGRLSSSDPNLQNIPIKGSWGERIRKCFIAAKGYRLMSSDYNQIELRILAHLSKDEKLVKDFRKGKDIHTSTAMQIFGLPEQDITSEMRRTGKTVNFGIVYGISAYGLSTTLGIPQSNAKRYIDSYFSYYQGIRRFIERTIEEASTRGYVTTLLSRRRAIPELSSSNRSIHAFGERTAVNTVIQGSAADLIKMAMIRISKRIRKEGLKSRMLLQIHDELVLEAANEEVETLQTIVRSEMEGIMALSVPLKVDLSLGHTWGSMSDESK